MSFTTHSTELDEQVRSLVEPIAAEHGLTVFDCMVVPSSKQVKVVLERDPSQVDPVAETTGEEGEASDGVTIGEITRVTKALNYLLDVEEVLAFEYRLEVSSPGIERELRTPAHLERHVGDRLRATLRETVDGRNVWEGEITGVDAMSVTVRDDEGGEHAVPLSAIKKAKTVFDFSVYDRQPKPGGKSKKKRTKT